MEMMEYELEGVRAEALRFTDNQSLLVNINQRIFYENN